MALINCNIAFYICKEIIAVSINVIANYIFIIISILYIINELTELRELTFIASFPFLLIGKVSSIVVEIIRTVLFFYRDILHKNKTHKYLNTPKKHNKAHKLGVICTDKIADKKIISNFLFKNKM